MEEEKKSLADRMGPGLATGVLVAIVSAATASALAMYRLVAVHDSTIAHLTADLGELRRDLDGFKQGNGNRFTASDGSRLEGRIDALQQTSFARQAELGRISAQLEECRSCCADFRNNKQR